MDSSGMSNTPVGTTPLGRRRSTTQAELSHIGLELFHDRGFEQTTVDDIATAAGIGRRTFFRYFPSKNDLPWGEFGVQLDRLRDFLNNVPSAVPLMEAVRIAVIEFNRLPSSEIPWHRRRMWLLLRVPALQAHSMLRYAEWRNTIAEFVSERLGVLQQDHAPQAVAWAVLGVALSAYEQWLLDEGTDLTELLDTALRMLGTGFDLE